MQQRCSYYCTADKMHRCPAFRKQYTRCGHTNIFKRVCRNPNKTPPKEMAKERCRAVHETCLDSENSYKEIDVARTQMLNFHSIRLGIITKLGTRTSHRRVILENNVHTGSNNNLMPPSLLKTIFPRLLKIFLDYQNSCIKSIYLLM